MRQVSNKGKNGFSFVLSLIVFFSLIICHNLKAGDIVQLKNGKRIEGKILSVSATLVTIRIKQGVLKVPRKRISSIILEQEDFNEPSSPPFSSGLHIPYKKPDNSIKIQSKQIKNEDINAQEIQNFVNKQKAPEEQKKPKTPDEAVEKILSRYIWLIPEGTGNKIALGMGILFIFTMILHFAAKLADVEEPSLPRSMVLSMGILGLILIELVIGFGLGWPVWTGFFVLNIIAWYIGCKVLIGEGFWKSTLMLIFTSFALLLCVLWVEVAGYILSI